MFLDISEKIDHFYFTKNNNSTKAEIFFSGPLQLTDVLNYIKTSLRQNKIVIVSCSQDLPHIDVSNVKFKNHYSLYLDNILILNYPLKNLINKNLDKNMTIQNFQELDSFLRVHLSNIFC
jgi:phosphopantothenoylcysteine synthetase/decarboxylase